VAEEDVPKVRRLHPPFDALADRREWPHFGRRVYHGRTDWRPARSYAASGSAAAAPATPATWRRGIRGRWIRRITVAAIAAIATVAAAASGAFRCCSSGAMSPYRCCASSHVPDDTG